MRKRLNRSLIASLTTLALAGCAAPPTQRLNTDLNADLNAELPLPERFTVAQTLAQTPKGFSDGQVWWKGFNDELLNGLIELALTQNSRVAQAVAQHEQSVAALQEADAADSLMSSLGLEAGGTAQNRGNTTNEGGRTQLSLRFSLPLDARGKISAQVEAAAASNRQAQAQLRGVLLAVSTEVAQEYLQYRGNQKQLSLLYESVALQRETLRIVQVRNQTGLSPELDVQRARTSVENLQANVPTLQQALSVSRNRLATLTGQPPGVMQALLQQASPLPSYERTLPEAIPVEVVNARPDIQASLEQVVQSMALAGVARADFYPALSLQSQVSLSHLSSTTPDTLLLGTLSALLDQVLTDGQARQARLSGAEARARSDLAAYSQQVRLVIEEVENQLAAINHSMERLQALTQAKQASRRSFEQADTLYQLGLVSFLDVVDAQRLRANAEQTLAAEQTRKATLIAGLFQRLGLAPINRSARSEPEDAKTSQ